MSAAQGSFQHFQCYPSEAIVPFRLVSRSRILQPDDRIGPGWLFFFTPSELLNWRQVMFSFSEITRIPGEHSLLEV